MAKAESKLFDLFYPSPVTLQELSSITISLELWRRELNTRRMNGTLYESFMGRQAISLKKIMPDVPIPTRIENMIRKHTEILGGSILNWLGDASDFLENNYDSYEILEFFDDFVCDFDGKIHDTRTTKRMLLNDKLSKMEKFRIACYNCLEDDIRLLWPFVSAEMENTLHDAKYELRYWIYHMMNKMDEFDRPEFFLHDIDDDDDAPVPNSIDEWMFLYGNWASSRCKAYFWNRLPAGIRSRLVDDLECNEPLLFNRFYLHKLNEADLNAITAHMRPFYTITNYLKVQYVRYYFPSKLHYGVAIFKYIKDEISESCFSEMMLHFLKKEVHTLMGRTEDENLSYAYCEIWNNAPDNLKSSAIEDIFSSDDLSLESNHSDLKNPRVVIFLKQLLLSTTFVQRSTFWHKHWFNLITTARPEDSYELMKLCCCYEANVANFRQIHVANGETIHRLCIKFMNVGDFEVLNDFLKNWFPEVRLRREFKQYLIRLFFFENDVLWKVLFDKAEQFDFFVNEIYVSIELDGFKKPVILSPTNQDRIVKFLEVLLLNTTFEQKMKFWYKQWFDLIFTERAEFCFTLWKLCFSDEVDMARFRENTMANWENIHGYHIRFMNVGNFKVVDDYLKFWFPEVWRRRELKKYLLHSFFFGNYNVPWSVLFDNLDQFHLFVHDVYYVSEMDDDHKMMPVWSPKKQCIIIDFLVLLLLNSSFEQRSVFWRNNWVSLITTIHSKDCFRIMKLCFFDEVDITQFRENTMANSEGIHQYCIKFMRNGKFNDLDIFLKFWFPEVLLRRKLKQRFLQSFFFENKSIPWDTFFDSVNQFNLFIKDAYGSSILIEDFIRQVNCVLPLCKEQELVVISATSFTSSYETTSL